jgi:hypothetical protein
MEEEKGKKPRSTSVYATTAGKVESITVSIDRRNGDVIFHDKVINTYNEVTYERAKGPKILSRIPIATANLQFDVDRSIWENFDIVFAIDTNTRPIKDRSVSVSGIIACQKIIAVSPDAVAEEVWR